MLLRCARDRLRHRDRCALLFFAGAASLAIGDGVLKERNKSGQRCERNSFMALVVFVSNTINNKDSDKEGLILSQPSADSSLCGGSQGRFRACGHEAVAFRSPPPPLRTAHFATRPYPNVGRSRPSLTETRPTHRRNQVCRSDATQAPAALRERGAGGEALLSEKRPLPQNLPSLPPLYGLVIA